jgi:hypothetical protein
MLEIVMLAAFRTSRDLGIMLSHLMKKSRKRLATVRAQQISLLFAHNSITSPLDA